LLASSAAALARSPQSPSALQCSPAASSSATAVRNGASSPLHSPDAALAHAINATQLEVSRHGRELDEIKQHRDWGRSSSSRDTLNKRYWAADGAQKKARARLHVLIEAQQAGKTLQQAEEGLPSPSPTSRSSRRSSSRSRSPSSSRSPLRSRRSSRRRSRSTSKRARLSSSSSASSSRGSAAASKPQPHAGNLLPIRSQAAAAAASLAQQLPPASPAQPLLASQQLSVSQQQLAVPALPASNASPASNATAAGSALQAQQPGFDSSASSFSSSSSRHRHGRSRRRRSRSRSHSHSRSRSRHRRDSSSSRSSRSRSRSHSPDSDDAREQLLIRLLQQQSRRRSHRHSSASSTSSSSSTSLSSSSSSSSSRRHRSRSRSSSRSRSPRRRHDAASPARSSAASSSSSSSSASSQAGPALLQPDPAAHELAPLSAGVVSRLLQGTYVEMRECLRQRSTADGQPASLSSQRRIVQPLDWLEAALGSLLPAQCERAQQAAVAAGVLPDSILGTQLDLLRQVIVYINAAVFYFRHSCRTSNITPIINYLEAHRRNWQAGTSTTASLAVPDQNMLLPAQMQAATQLRSFIPLTTSAGSLANAAAARAAVAAQQARPAAQQARPAAAAGASPSSSTIPSAATETKTNEVCRLFQTSRCTFGSRCKYRHVCPHCAEQQPAHTPAVCPLNPAASDGLGF
jgi:hypothetical protein